MCAQAMPTEESASQPSPPVFIHSKLSHPSSTPRQSSDKKRERKPPADWTSEHVPPSSLPLSPRASETIYKAPQLCSPPSSLKRGYSGQRASTARSGLPEPAVSRVCRNLRTSLGRRSRIAHFCLGVTPDIIASDNLCFNPQAIASPTRLRRAIQGSRLTREYVPSLL